MNKAGITLVICMMLSSGLVKAQDTFSPAEILGMFKWKMEEIKKEALKRSFQETEYVDYPYSRFIEFSKISKPEEEGGNAVKRGLNCNDAWEPWHPETIERGFVYFTTSYKEHESIDAWMEAQAFTVVENNENKREFSNGGKRWCLWESHRPRSGGGFVRFYFLSIDNITTDKEK